MNLAHLNDKAPVEAATVYADLGWPVFPIYEPVFDTNGEVHCSCLKPNCMNVGKHPRISTGVNGATVDKNQIKRWWTTWPRANVGLKTGNRLMVFDFDGKAGGLTNLGDVTASSPDLANTLTAKTGGGGLHLFALVPLETGKIDNRVGVWPGVDIRGDGGYVVAAPSFHRSRQRYEWVDEDRELKSVSSDLLEKIRILKDEEPIKLLMADKKPIPQGTRNHTLFKMASSRRSIRWPYEDTLEFLRRQNHERCDPPLEAEDIVKIIDSAYRLPPSFEKTDLGNARAVNDWFGRDLKFTKELGWLEFRDGVWERISDVRANHFAVVTTDMLLAYGIEKKDDDLIKHVFRSRSNGRLHAMMEQFQTHIETKITSFHSNPLELPCANGVYDLEHDRFRPSHRDDLVLRRIPIAYDARARCPMWEKTLQEWMGDDQEMVGYLQRMVGYFLTGDTREDAFFVLHGAGANGKTTFVNVLNALLGGFAVTMPSEYFMPNPRIAKDQYAAKLYGARLAVSSETSAFARLDEALVKSLSGKDKLTGKNVWKEPFDFDPTHKVVISTNFRPKITDDGYGLWRRVHLVPFTETFGKDRQNKMLSWELQKEAAGILRWAIEGTRIWLVDGLGFPSKVAEATAKYQQDMDTFGDFLQDCFILDETKKKLFTRSSHTFPLYAAWASETKAPKFGKQAFLEKLRGRSEIREGNDAGGVAGFWGIGEKPTTITIKSKVG